MIPAKYNETCKLLTFASVKIIVPLRQLAEALVRLPSHLWEDLIQFSSRWKVFEVNLIISGLAECICSGPGLFRSAAQTKSCGPAHLTWRVLWFRIKSEVAYMHACMHAGIPSMYAILLIHILQIFPACHLQYCTIMSRQSLALLRSFPFRAVGIQSLNSRIISQSSCLRSFFTL